MKERNLVKIESPVRGVPFFSPPLPPISAINTREIKPIPGAGAAGLELARQELAAALGPRTAEDLLRRALFLDPALVQEQHLARDLLGDALLVGHQQNGVAFQIERAHV